MVNDHHIAYHEKDLGKLFCKDSAKDILNMLLDGCRDSGVNIRLGCDINNVDKNDEGKFEVKTTFGRFQASSLVIASGGLSIPKMCASPFGYRVAEQFGHNIWPTRPGLVPLTLQPGDKEKLEPLSGVSVESEVRTTDIGFNENILFTHRGLSGPAILQISSYWQPGEDITIDLAPDTDIAALLVSRRKSQPNLKLKTVLADVLPKRLLPALLGAEAIETTLQVLSAKRIDEIAEKIQGWKIRPNGTEGYRTAEVTLGGVDCDELSSKTMESRKMQGLYFIGEVVDVTGWLGGYNFQWAWSSGWCAGQAV